MRLLLLGALLAAPAGAWADTAKAFDAAAAFGALPSVSNLRLSPDGKSVVYIAPAMEGPGNIAYTYDLRRPHSSKPALRAGGDPERLTTCSWVSNDRLVCEVFGVVKNPSTGLLPFTRLFAANRDGSDLKLLSTETNEYSRGYELNGGSVLDWLPDEDGAVLMTRQYLPDAHLGSHVGSTKQGLGVDHVDTRNLKVLPVEPPFQQNVSDYISDGRGTVRIREQRLKVVGNEDSGILRYLYRKPGSRDWLPLSTHNDLDQTGFRPVAVDHDRNIAYGFDKKDGRGAMYSMALDGSLQEALVYANPDVDVDGVITMGRRHRVVGVSFATEVNHVVYFDPDIDRLMRSLSKALPKQPLLTVVDCSVDEQTLLIVASSDEDPGVYYVFDRRAKRLDTLFTVRDELEGIKLANVRPITYPAADGTRVPGYLTLPPGVENPKGLPAIVLPHGGPSARDQWGFDWLSQFYASRGYAVVQPNFRGSAGYGDAWLQQNGFKSWRTAIGDVLDAGHWLVSEGIADPAKLSVVGWSYGGYAALQSAVTEPGFFKAVIAIAPATDLEQLKEEWRGWSNFAVVSTWIGEGAHVRDGSPARHADKIKVPVLMFHGTLDRNVSINQSRTMDARLEKAGVKHQLVTFEGLDHYLDDSHARAEMLRKSDEFLRAATASTQASLTPPVPGP
ncbi:MAG: S9 family peptidase [Pseudomonadota bacterium]|nr:S9 family peptidase [Pseudomonadota bacterium]